MKRILLILSLTFAAILIFMFWYWLTFRMGEALTFEIGDPTASQHMLIAYQGSPYKNDVVEEVTAHFSSGDVYIKAIDIAQLTEIDPAEWDAILIMHTWEVWQPPKPIADFHRAHFDLENAIYLTTSGDGEYHIEEVDAITTASILEDAHADAEEAIIRLEALID